MTVSSTITSKEQDKQEKKVSIDCFHIDMIPDAMEKMQWATAAKLMRHWFSIKPAYAFDLNSKDQAVNGDPRDLPPSKINVDIVKMAWAIQFDQVRNGIETLKKTWCSPKGKKQLIERLQNVGDFTNTQITLGSSEDVCYLDATAQINFKRIGNKTDPINAWYGAMGNSVLKICVRGSTTKINGKYVFATDALGFYLKDSYDFVDEGYTSEPLGIWSKDKILDKEESAIYMSSYLAGFFGELVRTSSGYVLVFNEDFRIWQNKHDTGGDYIILSDVLWTEVEGPDKMIFL
ncbi:DUF6402 family protein [Leclercia adecarboxylata]|uniref:DUF6402 family protein n=1 Tax=Leclercia adecarboxylata TaxID=83655 RepID=UPI0013FDF2E0|nr:DUF6402 family protein [Leclercia adecarboxylata]QIM43059.1 hypothetical protein G7098_09970 [Leclercia adecarboxylata]